jgi:hyaluronan synthase
MTALARFPRLLASTIWRLVLGVYLVALLGLLAMTKGIYLPAFWTDPFFAAYGLAVTVYLASRFLLSLFYRPARGDGPLPSMTIVIPAMNEEQAIAATIEAVFAVDYPRELLDVYVVDDGSTDGTWREIQRAAVRYPQLHALRFSHNRGKRAAMAAGIRASSADLICFVDSDSKLDPDALLEIARPFSDPRVAIATGHADVLNRGDNLLTRLQEVRYYVAFRVVKGSESLFGCVTCASGCFSAYRRDALLEVLDRWESQRFLGREATFGDDRALTNMLLRKHRVVYQSTARCQTAVPDTMRRFLVQQVRWKKSWLRESLIACTFFWRKHPVAAIATYASNVFPLLAPLIILRSVVVVPLTHGTSPMMYVVGLYAMAIAYSLYFGWQRRSPDWWAGVAFVALYAGILVWQTYWAVVTARKTAWGTRAGRVDDGGGLRIIEVIGATPSGVGIPVRLAAPAEELLAA